MSYLTASGLVRAVRKKGYPISPATVSGWIKQHPAIAKRFTNRWLFQPETPDLLGLGLMPRDIALLIEAQVPLSDAVYLLSAGGSPDAVIARLCPPPPEAG